MVAIGMSGHRYDFARVDKNISNTKFEVTYLKMSSDGSLHDMKRRGNPYKDTVNINSFVHTVTLLNEKVTDKEVRLIKDILLREFDWGMINLDLYTCIVTIVIITDCWESVHCN